MSEKGWQTTVCHPFFIEPAYRWRFRPVDTMIRVEISSTE